MRPALHGLSLHRRGYTHWGRQVQQPQRAAARDSEPAPAVARGV